MTHIKNNNTYNIADQVYMNIKRFGGCTMWTTRDVQMNGYLVAIKQYEHQCSIYDMDVLKTIHNYITKHINDGCAIGFWDHHSVIYCDVLMYYPYKKHAMYNAELNNQIAIWDLTNNRALPATKNHAAH